MRRGDGHGSREHQPLAPGPCGIGKVDTGMYSPLYFFFPRFFFCPHLFDELRPHHRRTCLETTVAVSRHLTIVGVLKPPSRSCCDDAEPSSQQCSACSSCSPLEIIVLIVLSVLSELSELSMLGVLSMLGLLSLLVLIVLIVLDQLVARGRRR